MSLLLLLIGASSDGAPPEPPATEGFIGRRSRRRPGVLTIDRQPKPSDEEEDWIVLLT